MKKKVIGSLLITGLMISAGVYWADKAAADEESFAPPLAAKIANRFGLNETEVNDFFNQWHEERQAEQQTARQERINRAVTDGVLTREQADALMAQHEEMVQSRGQARDQLKAWMEENDLDPETMRDYLGGPSGPGPGGRGMGGGCGRTDL